MTLADLRTGTREDGLRSVAAKRVLDLAVAGLALVLLSPIMMLIALAVALDSPGPILFRQTRIGKGGRLFRIFKFRTLRVEAADHAGIRQVVGDDLRLTGIGGLLRRTSLDELPQLVNVLAGDMSLVGPRPHVPGMLVAGVPYEEVVAEYALRHAVLPGITGWAQVSGLRGMVSEAAFAQARVEYDLAYIRSQSLLFDLRIIVLTVVREVLGIGRR